MHQNLRNQITFQTKVLEAVLAGNVDDPEVFHLVKDKLENMGVSLKFALFPSGATIFTWSLWQILWRDFQAQGHTS